MRASKTRLHIATYDISSLMSSEGATLQLRSGATFLHFWTHKGDVLASVLETTADVPRLTRKLRGFWLHDMGVTPVDMRKPQYVGHVFESQFQQALVFEELDTSPLPSRSD